jgi:hypothetical protein
MRILLDNCVDIRFARLITGHEVRHARDLGWQDLSNGNGDRGNGPATPNSVKRRT